MARPTLASTAAATLSSLKKYDKKEAERANSRYRYGGWVLRGALLLSFVLACVHFQPLGFSVEVSALFGAALALGVLLFEIELERVTLRRLIGGVVGSLFGLLGALLLSMVLAHTAMGVVQRSFTSVTALVMLTYLGLAIGAAKGDMLNLDAFGGVFSGEPSSAQQCKVLDTSVIIDGRIADICTAQFLEGTLLLPTFVLRELQMVADSADALKRQRGRRGLEILQRMQKNEALRVEIAEDDFPQVPEVDLKLIELAKRYNAKILTNDYNLNKVATLQGIDVLNINQLANALKPVVLPGEPMRVFILREGKEFGQGVAYLDDGTMVVVDGARRLINRAVDIQVTSVHQTTAGKMIFGKLDDRNQNQQATAAAGQNAPEHPGAPQSRESQEGRAPEGAAPRPVFPDSQRSSQ
jgi:uncharacterized protein YacL